MSITFSDGLEKTLRRATSIARAQNRASAEQEDLLLALTEDDETAAAFVAVAGGKEVFDLPVFVADDVMDFFEVALCDRVDAAVN